MGRIAVLRVACVVQCHCPDPYQFAARVRVIEGSVASAQATEAQSIQQFIARASGWDWQSELPIVQHRMVFR